MSAIAAQQPVTCCACSCAPAPAPVPPTGQVPPQSVMPAPVSQGGGTTYAPVDANQSAYVPWDQIAGTQPVQQVPVQQAPAQAAVAQVQPGQQAPQVVAPAPPATRATREPKNSATQRGASAQAVESMQMLGNERRIEAIDVSHWQGTINWRAVRNDGIRAAYMKATEGSSFVDDSFARNRRESRANGVVSGAYHYAQPSHDGGSVEADARAEAEHFLSVAQPQAGDLRPVLDLEERGSLNKAELSRWVLAFSDAVQGATGLTPMVYVSPSFWESSIENPQRTAQELPLWVAHWGVDSPSTPEGWDAWQSWQYTSSGSVDGISGRVDRNIIDTPTSLVIGG